MLMTTIQQHIDYNYWAHQRVWGCVLKLSDAQFSQPLSYSQGSVQQQLVHMLWAEDVWLSRIVGAPAPTYSAADLPTRAEIRAKWDALEAHMRATVSVLDDAALLRGVRYSNSRGEMFEQSVLQILLHVVNHGTDHRAQTLAMMHTLGAETTEQDLIFYLRA